MQNKLFCLLVLLGGAVATVIPDVSFGYVPINPTYQSNMFWWLSGAQVEDRTSVPLVIWLQGGPGGSGFFGNFLEIGPQTVNQTPRNTTWAKYANLLFVDNPIGTGFSYTRDPAGFSTTDQEVADNLVTFLQQFLLEYPVFHKTPFWIFCESYGGKMASYFGMTLANAIDQGKIDINFKGVGIGDGWVGPLNCMYSYSPYLVAVGEIDQAQADNITWFAQQADVMLERGLGTNATNMWSEQQELIMQYTGNANFYNFLHFDDYIPDGQLSQLVNGAILQQLGALIPSDVTWGGQSGQVFTSLSGDFMKPSVFAVESLLDRGYQVAVYNGQLDIIVDTLCTESWMNQLSWGNLQKFLNAPRNPVTVDESVGGYVQSYDNLSFWVVNHAGHMVPYDNADTALFMFQAIISGNIPK